MGGSLRLGRIFGIPIEVNASWAVAFVLLTFLLSQEFRESRLGWPEAQRWLVAVAVVILIFLSVLTHELSHSVLARREGVRVRGITLFIFGGVSRLAREPDRPLTEFTIAVVGPLTSLVLAGVFGGVWFLLDAWEGGSTPEVIFFLLAWSNLALGLFNILPGYPLDGGRVLRAIVWGITGSHRKATRVAARAGQVIGGAMVLLGLFLGIFVDVVDGVWVAVIGLFLFSVATAGYREQDSQVGPVGFDA